MRAAGCRRRKPLPGLLTTSQRSSATPRPGGPYDWEVDLPRGVAGLPSTSTAKCAEVYTLLKDQLIALIGTVPREYLRRVDAALTLALSLSTEKR